MSGLQGYAAEGVFLRTRFEAQWADRTPIAWPNDDDFEATEGEPWVRFTVNGDDGAAAASIGAPESVRHRFPGSVLVEVFTPKGSSTNENDTLCDAVIACYIHYTGSGVRFFTPQKIPVGVEGGWFKQDVLCPFERDTIFTS